jgi:hypothetical protein
MKTREDPAPSPGPLQFTWPLLDSNQRPHRCERCALPAELSGLPFSSSRTSFHLNGPSPEARPLQYPQGESNPRLLAENQVS